MLLNTWFQQVISTPMLSILQHVLQGYMCDADENASNNSIKSRVTNLADKVNTNKISNMSP